MALVDRCIFNSGVSGLSDFTVASAVQGYMTPTQAGAIIGQTYSYAAELRAGLGVIQQWELGAGIWDGTTVARTTIYFSSFANAKVAFASAPDVTLTPLETDILQTVTDDGNVTSTFNGSSLALALSTITTATTAGSATTAPLISVDAKGRTTALSSVLITPSASSITTAGNLTAGSDTNVILTLGGTSTGATLQNVSVTAGWTGTLALTRLAPGLDGEIIVGRSAQVPIYATVSGDASISTTGSLTLTSITTATTAGSATTSAIVSIDAKGRVTALSAATITATTLTTAAFANPTGTVGLSAVNGTATTAMRSDGAPALSVAIVPTWTGTHTFSNATLAAAFGGGGITITTTSGSLVEGILSTQVGPNTGTSVGPQRYNQFIVSDGTDLTGGSNDGTAFYIQHNILSNAVGQKFGLYVNSQHTSTTANTGDQIAGVFLASTNATNTGPNSGTIYAVNPIIQMGNSATGYLASVGIEADMDLSASATTQNRVAFSAADTSAANVRGSVRDVAFELTAQTGTGATGWGTGLQFSDRLGTSLYSGGSAIVGEGTHTVVNGFSFPLWTFTGNFLASNNYTVAGSGQTTYTGNATISSASTGFIDVSGTITNSGLAVVGTYLHQTFSGASSAPAGISVQPTFSPSASIAAASGSVLGLRASPAVGVTITDLYGAYVSETYLDVAGAVTTGHTVAIAAPSIVGALKPGTQYGLHILNQGISGTTLSTALLIDAQSGSTTNISLNVADTTDATSSTVAPSRFAGGVAVAKKLFAGTSVTSPIVNVGPNVAPNYIFTVNANTVAPPGAPSSSPVMQVVGADAQTSPIFLFDAYMGANATRSPFITMRSARGTAAAFTATQSGDFIGFFGGVGANANDTWGFPTGASGGAFFGVAASETWSSTAGGAEIRFYTTPNTTQAIAIAGRFQNSGGLSIGTATDPGIGSLQVNANIYAPNLPTTTAALAAALCWTVTTGQFQRDTNAGGCLVSARSAKDIHGPLAPRSAFDIVMNLKPEIFHYRPGFGDSGKYEQIGFIADEVAEADKRFAIHDDDGDFTGVRYMQITAALAGAIQHLNSKNDDLRDELRSLRQHLQ